MIRNLILLFAIVSFTIITYIVLDGKKQKTLFVQIEFMDGSTVSFTDSIGKYQNLRIDKKGCLTFRHKGFCNIKKYTFYER